MPTLSTQPKSGNELADALSEADEKEVRRMVRSARMARGRFHLFPVECNLTGTLRMALLARLREEFAANGQRLHVLTLTKNCWNLFTVLEQTAPVEPQDVVLLVGLEGTPGIIREPGAKPQRPSSLAVLNQGRESLRMGVHSILRLVSHLCLQCPARTRTRLL